MRVFLVSHAVYQIYFSGNHIPYFEVFDVNSLYWGNTAQRVCRHCWVLRVVFAQITLGLVYGMITVPTLGPIPAPRAFRNPFGRTPKSIVWAIRHWGGGVDSDLEYSNIQRHYFCV